MIGKSISYFADGISKVVSNYSNLTCKIHLTCDDQVIRIDTKFKNGHLEQFNLDTRNINFVNSSKYTYNDVYNNSRDRVKELLCLTDPKK